jgi:hypothetical protein
MKVKGCGKGESRFRWYNGHDGEGLQMLPRTQRCCDPWRVVERDRWIWSSLGNVPGQRHSRFRKISISMRKNSDGSRPSFDSQRPQGARSVPWRLCLRRLESRLTDSTLNLDVWDAFVSIPPAPLVASRLPLRSFRKGRKGAKEADNEIGRSAEGQTSTNRNSRRAHRVAAASRAVKAVIL